MIFPIAEGRTHAALIRSALLSMILGSLVVAGCDGNDPASPNNTNGSKPSGRIFAAKLTGSLMRIDLGAGTITTLPEGTSPFPTADNKIVATGVNGESLIELSADGTQSRVILRSDRTNASLHDNNFQFPQVSPDGTRIAYGAEVNNGDYRVYVVNRSDGSIVAWFDNEGSYTGFVRPSWTPDGRVVMASVGQITGLYLSDADLTSATRFDDNLNAPTDPKVSPDGRTVAFVMSNHIYTVGIDGRNLQQITSSGNAELKPTWSPDGQWLAFYHSSEITFTKVGSGTTMRLSEVAGSLDQFSVYQTNASQLEWR